ncbi:copper chaperone PCu(A)C [Rothia sp. ZJ932]|uniref:copper chaperone PCu(A)C n=1 Tax=Rothia sp. ZJ932 TaxID=2810516 RepID=UPI0019671033|nr:copper chaperone PCu(A)C [Rothia sp. ZJ932]QRZ61306.1 copper chaperone PCu(A)C [Rothia sp. ZJ932]
MNYRPLAAIVAFSFLALTGCSASDTEAISKTTTDAASSTAVSAEAPLELADGWVKAADKGMTAAFGTLTNTSEETVTITGAASAATDTVQLHVTEIDPTTGTSTMKEAPEGFTIEPGESFTMEPGGSHIMFMDLGCSLPTGSTLDVAIETPESSKNFTFAVRDYQGAQEEYAPGDEHSAAAMEHTAHGAHSADDEHEGHDHADHAAVELPICAQ